MLTGRRPPRPCLTVAARPLRHTMLTDAQPLGREAGGHGDGQVPREASPSQEPLKPDVSKPTFQVENNR